MSDAIYVPANWFVTLRWEDLFVRQQPVEIDLGCGKGAFLMWAVQNQPAMNFVGVDRLLGRLHKVAAKIERAGANNVRLLRIESSYFVQHLVPPGSVSAYHIYFPDPWPKRRHQDRRLFQEAFVSGLRRSLVAGGVVNVATDDAAYAEQIRKVMGRTGEFTDELPCRRSAEGQTEFERLYREAGRPVHELRWRG